MRERIRTRGLNYGLGFELFSPPVRYQPSRLSSIDLMALASLDRRLWTPDPVLRPGATPRRAGRLTPSTSTAPGSFPAGVKFADPKRVAVCVRRRIRREVIMAKGKGGGGHRPPRRSYWTDVDC